MNTLFFWASKLGWAVLRPETLFIFLILGAFWSARRNNLHRARRLLGLVVICVLAIGFLPLGALISDPLEARYPARPALDHVNAIIVLGGAEKPETTRRWGEPSLNAAGDHYVAALELARRFPEAKVYFAGGSGKLTGSDISEASIARSIFHATGLAPARLRLEATSRNTAENATRLRKLIGDKYSGEAVLVTSAPRMPRAMAAFCAAGWKNLVAWPTDYSTGYFQDEIGWNFADNLGDLNEAVKEWIGLVAYRLTGRTHKLLGADCSEANTPAH